MVRYYLGVDAGGSTCRARLVDAAGTVLGSAEAGPANANLGPEKLYATLMAVCDAAFARAGLGAAAMAETAAGFGIAGLSRPGAREGVDAMRFPFASVAVDTDAAIAHLGGLAGADGAVLILGTGSIAYVRVGEKSFSIGGYGFPISDEGSGAALGLSAMRHALRALDGRTRRTPFGSAITARFDHDITRVIGWMQEASPKDYAALAPLVMEHADAGDEIAVSIVEDATLHVERFIETIFRLGAPACVLMGGLSGRLQPWLRARTVARLSVAKGDGVDGALRLAGLG